MNDEYARDFLSILNIFMCFFMLVYTEWVLGTHFVYSLHFLFKLLSTETELKWIGFEWTKRRKGTRKHTGIAWQFDFPFWFLFIICFFGIPQSISMWNWKGRVLDHWNLYWDCLKLKWIFVIWSRYRSHFVRISMSEWIKPFGHIDRNIPTNWQWKWQIEQNESQSRTKWMGCVVAMLSKLQHTYRATSNTFYLNVVSANLKVSVYFRLEQSRKSFCWHVHPVTLIKCMHAFARIPLSP